jgi:hypothetical protein
VSRSSFKDEREAFTSALSQALASIMTNVAATDIYEVTIQDDKMDGTVLSYDVRLWSDTTTFDSLSGEIRTATENGDLENAIQTQAAATPGAEALTEIQLLDTESDITTRNRLHPNHASVKLTGTQITMVVISVVMFCVFLTLLVAFGLLNKEYLPTLPPSPLPSPRKYREP